MEPIALNVIVDELVEMNHHFSTVAAGEGVSPLLVGLGTGIIVVTLGLVGFLALGAVASLFTSD